MTKKIIKKNDEHYATASDRNQTPDPDGTAALGHGGQHEPAYALLQKAFTGELI